MKVEWFTAVVVLSVTSLFDSSARAGGPYKNAFLMSLSLRKEKKGDKDANNCILFP